MHRVGLGGAYLMPIKGVEQGPQYEGKAQQLTPEWWRMVTHSMKEAAENRPKQLFSKNTAVVAVATRHTSPALPSH